MTKVKICGLTNLEDALIAIEAGADYLGFIFYPPSKRGIDVKEAQCIVSHLRGEPNCPTLIGVFVDETAEKMAEVLDFVDLDLAQLSGNEVPSLLGEESSPIYGRCYKAIKPTSYTEAEADAEWFVVSERYFDETKQIVVPTLMIDAYHPTLHGGSGEVSDWAISQQLVQTVPGLMLAGGLTPDNVATAVSQIRPFCVDVASGVEASPGKKDHQKVRQFIQNAKAA